MISVIRLIEYYEKYDKESEELGSLVGKYDISDVPIRKLKSIVKANDGDIYLYDVYDLTKEQLIALNDLLAEPIDYHLEKYDYCLSCIAMRGYYQSHKIRGNRKGGYPAPF